MGEVAPLLSGKAWQVLGIPGIQTQVLRLLGRRRGVFQYDRIQQRPRPLPDLVAQLLRLCAHSRSLPAFSHITEVSE